MDREPSNACELPARGEATGSAAHALRRRAMKRASLVVIATLVAIGAIIAVWLGKPDAGWNERHSKVQAGSASAAQIERGRYLVTAGDCVACHTATGG